MTPTYVEIQIIPCQGSRINRSQTRKAPQLNWNLAVYKLKWSQYKDSNLGPPRPKRGALARLRYTEIKLGGSGRTRTCFYNIYYPESVYSKSARRYRDACGIALVIGEGACSAHLCFNHVKLLKPYINILQVRFTLGLQNLCRRDIVCLLVSMLIYGDHP